jgi:Tol biopolymer transport system component
MTLKLGNPLLVAALLPLASLPAKAQETIWSEKATSATPLASSLLSAELLAAPSQVNLSTPLQNCAAQIGTSKIFFAAYDTANNLDVYSIRPDGTNQVRLTYNSARDSYPSCDATGSKVVFSSNRDGNNEIYSMNADGTSVRRLTNTPESEFYPSVSKDGRKIVFVVNNDISDDIWVMNSDGTRRRKIISIPLPADNYLWVTDPVFSFDGSMVAFWYQVNTSALNNICISNSDGTGLTQLTNPTDFNTNGTNPSFSPDGRRLIYTRGNLWSMDIDGGNRTVISGSLGAYFLPSYSQEGNQVAFIGSETSPSSTRDLYVWNVSHAFLSPRRLTFSGKVEFCRPSWAQTASQIGF